MRNQLVYDLPTRFFHWLFVGMFIVAFFIGKTVDDESPVFTYHMLIGLVMSFAVVLRIIWGFFGTKYAKFSSFLLNPVSLFNYFSGMLTGKSMRSLGHNPASSWAALVMMALGAGLGVTGYLMTTGNKETFEDLHEILANTFLIVAIMHIAGIIIHTIKHKEAIGLSMVDGKKQAVEGETMISSSRPAVGVIFLILVAIYSFNLYRNFNPQNGTLGFLGTTLQLGENESDEGRTEADNGNDD